MARKDRTPSYVLELEMRTTARDRKILDKKMRIGKQIYNACLGEAQKRLRAVLADKPYRLTVKAKQAISAKYHIAKAKKAKKRTAEEKEIMRECKRLADELHAIEQSYGYSEYQLHTFVAPIQAKFAKNIGSFEAQKLATRAFNAVEKIHYRQAKKVHFKHHSDEFSIDNKSNTTGLRYVEGYILWGEQTRVSKKNPVSQPKKGAIKVPLIVKRNDRYAQMALCDRTKYVRVIAREIRGEIRYFAQLVQEGFPPDKSWKKNRKVSGEVTKRVGLDVGTSTLAISSEKTVELHELAPECVADNKELRKIERAMDRSKRATHPDNYNEDGTIKRSMKLEWHFSKRYLRLKMIRKDLHRKLAVKRKQSHEILSNHILSLGSDIRVETMRIQGLQRRAKKTTRNKRNGKINKKKRYGKVIANRAPAMLMEIIDRKLHYQGRTIKKINTSKVKASQFNHVTGEYNKKDISERWNEGMLGERIQRDLYSAFLIGNTVDTLDAVAVDLCNQGWQNFVTLHHQEVTRLQRHWNKQMRWYVA
ncbi:transposase [Sporosarcina sp. ACRSM]|uniref:transposase n=1 Tax=Sporosarcina sp. ACRSM TaxID=2918216 RepID=UPI001EF4FCB9|nr:transposase [Sporosarcina sp. ACRSM]MCG7336160.1 transposase [Sporosarcina sp. ACRSM]